MNSDIIEMNSISRNNDEKHGRNLVNMMVPGDRVSSIDKSSAICTADSGDGQEVEIVRTVVDYYYAIESTDKITTKDSIGRTMIRLLENKLFRSIRPAVLWCYFDEPQNTRRNLLRDVADAFDKGDHLRKLTLEEARRRLSIVSVSNNPDDEETTIECNFPTNHTGNCTVMHGKVTVMHHATSDVSLAVASIFDSTQKAMDYNEIFIPLDVDENAANITNIEWLGETEEEAINGGPIIVSDVPIIGEVNIDEIEQKENKQSLLAYALTIPVLLLIAFALLVTKKKTKRKIKTREQVRAIRSFDDVLIGTGDPPGSFHEGMYHYTCQGVRYLSTNCADCIETKRNGFFTALDLETISEKSLEDDEDFSTHRKKHFVNASQSALGKKHSSIDVHVCNSARCPICTYKPRDVCFVSRSENFLGALREGELEV